ncbi:MAG TPA: N(4)-(beta-N-acetylglucosaminyl)-L-asparaginase [Gemmatimonadales bacterium]|nr:N(4)-(beta-N-acetylglucosaminyl)-L-asparaginase [Gemmatimonadales bacterium]
MTDSLSRRDFVLSSAAAMPLARTALRRGAGPGAPAIVLRPPSRPCVVASANGIRGVAKAMDLIAGHGSDPLDAVIEAVKIEELDPDDMYVGYGGLPNAEGVVQLDAACMHGPTRRAGAVGALEGIKTPSEVAKCVLRYTNHILLVGRGAQDFAVQFGFKIEDLLTDRAREAWLHWRANLNPSDNYRDVPESQPMVVQPHGTINCSAVDAGGAIASVTSTSGAAWKIPGRLGDSPIVGAGLYVDNDVGAAGSTGLGECNIMVCGGYTTVEGMRRGLSPTDACLETLRRAVAMSEPRLLDANGRPTYGLNYYAVNKRGEFGSAAFYPGSTFAVHDGREARIVDAASLYPQQPQGH